MFKAYQADLGFLSEFPVFCLQESLIGTKKSAVLFWSNPLIFFLQRPRALSDREDPASPTRIWLHDSILLVLVFVFCFTSSFLKKHMQSINTRRDQNASRWVSGDRMVMKTQPFQGKIQDFGQGLAAEFCPQGGLRSFAQKRGFSFKIAWKMHDFEKILGQGGPGPQGPLDPLVRT